MVDFQSISIIIPIYNRAWCIERCLKSAVHFLTNTNFGEIVIVDDASTDNSLKIVKKFFNKKPTNNITYKIIELKKNSGVCAAKNTGARNASNNWLIFLDSDDEIISERVNQFFSRAIIL